MQGNRNSPALGVMRSPAFVQGLFLAAVAVLIYLSPGDLPLSGDEAMYAAVAKGVAAGENPLDLRLNGLPYLNKPPLFFLAVGAAFRLAGTSDRVAQLTAAFFSVLAVLALYLACRITLGSWETGFLSALVFLMTPEVIHWGRGVRLEGMLGLFSIVAVTGVCLSVDRAQALMMVFVASALACLAKGPQGLFPLILLPFLWWREGGLGSRRSWVWLLLGAGSFVLLVVPWLWWRWKSESLFANVYLGDQVLATVVGKPWPGRGPTWYAGKLFRTYWPWLPFALAGVASALAGKWHSDGESISGGLARAERCRRSLLVWGWYAVVVFVAITVSALKKGRYLYLLYPSLSVFSGIALAWLARRLPYVRPALMTAAVALAIGMLLVGDTPSPEAWANINEALAVAGSIPDGSSVLLTSSVAKGRHGFGKILGFYAREELRACEKACSRELEGMNGNVWVIMRRREVSRFKRLGMKGKLVFRTARLAVMVFHRASRRAK